LPSPEPIEVAPVPIAGERREERPTGAGDPPASTDAPPSRLRWRSEWLEVCRWIGPERIVLPWWPEETEASGTATVPSAAARDPPHRDYFRVEDHHGRWLWVFCERPVERWFVHGAWV
ncbi:MAG: hypothetical protein KDA22_02285, partial [Phycisphaerales bacterium]|nr:hypothetical protein [Phycisphaerales bacterium]